MELFYYNSHGVRIKKCCASCKHKTEDNKMRYCLHGKGFVSSNSCCGDWIVSDGLENAGIGRGKVKKQEYLQYCINAVHADYFLPSDRKNTKRRSLAEIRREFEEENGDIFYFH